MNEEPRLIYAIEKIAVEMCKISRNMQEIKEILDTRLQ